MERHNDFSRETYDSLITMYAYEFIRATSRVEGHMFVFPGTTNFDQYDVSEFLHPEVPHDSPFTVQELSEKNPNPGAWDHASEHPEHAASTLATELFNRDILDRVEELIEDNDAVSWDSDGQVFRIDRVAIPETPHGAE